MNANRELPTQVSDNDYNPQHDVDVLKSLIVNAENLDIIKQKLNRTRAYRKRMLQNNETEIKEHFPYFFSHPFDLVNLFSFIHFSVFLSDRLIDSCDCFCCFFSKFPSILADATDSNGI